MELRLGWPTWNYRPVQYGLFSRSLGENMVFEVRSCPLPRVVSLVEVKIAEQPHNSTAHVLRYARHPWVLLLEGDQEGGAHV